MVSFFAVLLWVNMDCRDWCISRQLWWGHQIPAYRVLNTRLHSDTVGAPHLLVHYMYCLSSIYLLFY